MRSPFASFRGQNAPLPPRLPSLCRLALSKAQLYDAYIQHGEADSDQRVYNISGALLLLLPSLLLPLLPYCGSC